MSDPKCPKCSFENTYEDGSMWICPQCSHEWVLSNEVAAASEQVVDDQVRDANGNLLSDGDTVVVVKDLKVKGASTALKSGTKVKNIRLQSGHDDHNISCKIDGFGAMNLKSEFVKKA